MEQIDVSESYKVTGAAPVYSPDGAKLASAVEHRLVLRDAETLEVEQLVQCPDKIDAISFAPDADLVLAVSRARGAVQVASCADGSYSCNINEGSAGLCSALFTPDARHVISIAEHSTRVSVWSLLQRELVAAIAAPKMPEQTLCFSADGQFMALVHRRDAADNVVVYDTSQWQPVCCFGIGTADACMMRWSRSGALALVDSPLEGRVLIYSPLGEQLMRWHMPDNAPLGVRCLSFESGGELLVAGAYDNTARVFNSLTWSEIASLPHEAKIVAPRHAAIYFEQNNANDESHSEYVIGDLPVHLSHSSSTGNGSITNSKNQTATRSDDGPPIFKSGVHELQWSFDSRFLATRSESEPHVVRLWDVSRLELCALLVQKGNVRSMAWDPTQSRLAVCTGTDKVYLWTPDGASCIRIPLPGITITRVAWHPQGSAMIMSDKHSMTCGYFSNPAEEDNNVSD